MNYFWIFLFYYMQWNIYTYVCYYYNFFLPSMNIYIFFLEVVQNVCITHRNMQNIYYKRYERMNEMVNGWMVEWKKYYNELIKTDTEDEVQVYFVICKCKKKKSNEMKCFRKFILKLWWKIV